MRTPHFLRRSAIAMPFLVLLASCAKQDATAPAAELTLRHELDFSIPPGQQGQLDLTTIYDARSSAQALLGAHGYSMDQLRDVRIVDARAVMMEPVNAPFNGWSNVQLQFSTISGTAVPFAHLDPVPGEQHILELLVDHIDLTRYFQQNGRVVHARLGTDRPLSGDTARVRFALTFRVKAGD